MIPILDRRHNTHFRFDKRRAGLRDSGNRRRSIPDLIEGLRKTIKIVDRLGAAIAVTGSPAPPERGNGEDHLGLGIAAPIFIQAALRRCPRRRSWVAVPDEHDRHSGFRAVDPALHRDRWRNLRSPDPVGFISAIIFQVRIWGRRCSSGKEASRRGTKDHGVPPLGILFERLAITRVLFDELGEGDVVASSAGGPFPERLRQAPSRSSGEPPGPRSARRTA